MFVHNISTKYLQETKRFENSHRGKFVHVVNFEKLLTLDRGILAVKTRFFT